MHQNLNKANYQKAKALVHRLVTPLALKDAPPPSYKQEEKKTDKNPQQKNSKNNNPQEPIDYPVTLQPTTNNYSDNHYQSNSRAEPQLNNNNDLKPEWHITMLASSRKKSSPRPNKPPKKQTLKFNSANTLISSSNCKIGKSQEWERKTEVNDKQLYAVLQSKFRLREFRNNQKAIIKCTMLNNDVFVCMPTGGGKSLTFQVPLSLESGVTFCILPLVSLIFDQEMQAHSMNIRAYGLTGNTEYDVVKQIYKAIEDCEESKQGILIFSTPEKLNRSQKLIQVLTSIYEKGLFRRIVIDEVHCVSTWGRDFRKQYTKLGMLKKLFPSVPILALTATASQQIRDDIIAQLGIKGCYFFQSSFNRPNLLYEVLPKNPTSILSDISSIILDRHRNECGIVYCSTKKQTEEVANLLKKKGISAHHYHGQMPESLKKQVQQNWINDVTNVIVATIAFGMGINKPNVRFVIHYSFSKSLENYYQESGRAGRDGGISECILFFRYSDVNTYKFLISKNDVSTEANKSYALCKLNEMISYCQDTTTCRRKIQLNYFGEDFDPVLCNFTCDNCKRDHQEDAADEVNCYNEAHSILTFLLEIKSKRESITQTQLCDFIKGKNKKLGQKLVFFQKKNISNSCYQLFKGPEWKQTQLKRFVQELLSKGYLHQQLKKIGQYPVTLVTTTDIKLEQLDNEGFFIFKFSQKNRKNKKKGNKTWSSNEINTVDKQLMQGEDELDSVNFQAYNYQNVSSLPNTDMVMDKAEDEQLLALIQQMESDRKNKDLVKEDAQYLEFILKEYG